MYNCAKVVFRYAHFAAIISPGALDLSPLEVERGQVVLGRSAAGFEGLVVGRVES